MTELLDVLIDENLLDEAWRLAVAHPNDLHESQWYRLIELREAYRRSGDETGFTTYLIDLRARHKRRTSFTAKLDRAGLRP